MIKLVIDPSKIRIYVMFTCTLDKLMFLANIDAGCSVNTDGPNQLNFYMGLAMDI
jgi:hypothetical protein